MIEETKYEHSKLKIIGTILLIGGTIGSAVNAIITNDINIGFPLIACAGVGGMLMMVGLLNEM